jgi:hypothetical protein
MRTTEGENCEKNGIISDVIDGTILCNPKEDTSSGDDEDAVL